MGLPFGGLSGLTTRDAGREILGISDAQQGGRVYQFELQDPAGTLRVVTLNAVPLAMAPGDEHPDREGITLLPDGSYAVSAEGADREPRLPPSVNIYGRYGDFVRSLKIPGKFVPNADGPQTKGARGNAGFESLTLTPDERPALHRDRDGAGAGREASGHARARRAMARILEYRGS